VLAKKRQQEDLDSVGTVGQRADWLGATQTRRRRFRRFISLSHHITFFLGRRYKKSFRLIFVLGYPKSGTSWVCQLVSDYLRLPFPQHSVFPIGCAAVVHGHEVVSKKYPIGVYVMRDGRDVVISAYHHLHSQFKAGGGKRKNSAFFRSIDTTAPIKDNLAAFIDYSAANPFGSKKHWGQHIESFAQAKNPNIFRIKYEDLLETPHATLHQLFSQLSNTDVDDSQLNESIERFSFNRLSGRKRGEENQQSYLRKGTSGDWKNHFTNESARRFHTHFGRALIEAGYEADDSWVNQPLPAETQENQKDHGNR